MSHCLFFSLLNIMFGIFIAIMLFQLGGLIIPGPDFATVFRHSIHKGQKYGIICAMGIALGVMINLLITYFIGSALSTKYSILYIMFISLGLIYLYYISISLIINFLKHKQIQDINSTQRKNLNQPFINGLICNLSNAKVIVFFSSLLPLVNKLNIQYKILTWFSMGVSTLIWFSIVAILFNHNKIRILFLTYIQVIELIIGIIIFTFASIIIYNSVIMYFIQSI